MTEFNKCENCNCSKKEKVDKTKLFTGLKNKKIKILPDKRNKQDDNQ